MIKTTLLNLMKVSGAFDLTRIAHRRQSLILTYHRFSTMDKEDFTTARAFSEQLEYLTSHYHLVSLGQMAECLNSPDSMPLRLAAITIDDGYRDSYDIAFPLLKRCNVPATVFLVTEFADRRAWMWTDKPRYICTYASRQQRAVKIGGWELMIELADDASRRQAALRINDLLKQLPNEAKEESLERVAKALGVFVPRTPPEELSSITWEQAKEMDSNGIEIGSHTMTHPILTNITDVQLQRELVESRLRIEEVLGRNVEQFCYPNGDNDGRVQCEVARAGYRVAVTTVNGLNKRGDDPLTLRRIHTERDLAHFIQSTSGFEQLKNKVRNFGKRSAFTSPAPLSAQH